MQVLVRDNNVDQALRALKKKMQREGIFREMKMRRNYEKPSERKAREKGGSGPASSEAAAQAPGARRLLVLRRLKRSSIGVGLPAPICFWALWRTIR